MKIITEKQYNDALSIVDQYRKQSRLSVADGSSKIDVYEYARAEMMGSTDITLEEFEELFEMWLNIKKKELSIREFEKSLK